MLLLWKHSKILIFRFFTFLKLSYVSKLVLVNFHYYLRGYFADQRYKCMHTGWPPKKRIHLPQMSAWFFCFFKRSKILTMDRVTGFCRYKWIPFFGGHPVTYVLPSKQIGPILQYGKSAEKVTVLETCNVRRMWTGLQNTVIFIINN